MSYINLEFLKENFANKKIIFFDIGAADLWDTKDFAEILPKADIYAFEPLKDYYTICTKRASEYNVKFYNYAVSDICGDVVFYPSVKQGNHEQLQSSSMFKKTEKNIVTYGIPYNVKSTTIESFCDEHNISPDFIHIDVEGMEFNVFKKLGKYRPAGIWVEMIGYRYYEIGRKIEGDVDTELHELLVNYGYEVVFKDDSDFLYLHKKAKLKNRNYKK